MVFMASAQSFCKITPFNTNSDALIMRPANKPPSRTRFQLIRSMAPPLRCQGYYVKRQVGARVCDEPCHMIEQVWIHLYEGAISCRDVWNLDPCGDRRLDLPGKSSPSPGSSFADAKV